MITTGTTIAASHKLGLSQSTVSRALANLEDRSGATLFTRDGNRLMATAEALRINQSLDELFAALGKIEGGAAPQIAQQLTIAAPPTIAHRFLQPHIASFIKNTEMTSVTLEVCASDALLNGVAEERFDIGITDLETQHSGIQVTPFRRSYMVCAMPDDDPLVELEEVSSEDLAERDMIALTKRHSARTSTDRILRSAGITPRIVVETATAVSAMEFVRNGTGLALLNPFPIAASLPEGVVMRKFKPQYEFQTSFWTAINTALDAPARAFMRHAKFSTLPDLWSEPF